VDAGAQLYVPGDDGGVHVEKDIHT
jgi:hypothetical protein